MPFTRVRHHRRHHDSIDISRRVRLNDWERLEDRLAPALLLVTSAEDSGPGTLRAAITTAEQSSTHDIIRFDPSLINATIRLRVADDTEFGPTALKVSTPITIEGSGQTLARSIGAGSLRLFRVTADGELNLSGLTLRDGYAQGGEGGSGATGGGGGAGVGGAIFNQGRLSIHSSALIENHAIGGGGGRGGLFTSHGSGGTLGDNGSSGQFPGESSGDSSGGMAPFGGGGDFDHAAGFGGGGSTGSVGFGGGTGSLYAGGGGAGLGGAIFNLGGVIDLVNTTFAHNAATAGPGGIGAGAGRAGSGSGFGGAIFNLSGSLTVIYTTIAHNSVSTAIGNAGTATGGAIFNAAIPISGLVGNAAHVTLVNSILASSRGGLDVHNHSHPDAHAVINVRSPNIITTLHDATKMVNLDDVIQADPKLGPLNRNGGNSPSFSLKFGSPAFNAGQPAVTGLVLPPHDQRNASRDNQPDIGSFEVVHPLAPVGGILPPTQSMNDLTYLQHLYGSILNRPAMSSEIDQHLMDLETGIGWLQIAQDLWESEEHHLIQAEHYLISVLGTVPTHQNVTDLAAEFANGQSGANVLANLLSSPLFSDNKNDPSFVSSVYFHLLGREPTKPEMFNALLELHTGTTRPELVADILASRESIERAVMDFAKLTLGNENINLDAFIDSVVNGSQSLSSVFVKLLLTATLFTETPVEPNPDLADPIDTIIVEKHSQTLAGPSLVPTDADDSLPTNDAADEATDESEDDDIYALPESDDDESDSDDGGDDGNDEDEELFD